MAVWQEHDGNVIIDTTANKTTSENYDTRGRINTTN